MLDDWKSLLSQGSSSEPRRRKLNPLRSMCGRLVTETLELPNCTSVNEGGDYNEGRGYYDDTTDQFCNRDYDLYIPTSVCEHEHYREVNILPLVFAVHCYGCHPKVMEYLVDYAETYRFILAIPHGIDASFNAQQCCGTALEQNVDDVGFFESLISTLSTRWSGHLVSPDLVYGFGWSNGGYMVVNAAHLFRAIAPVSGYQVYDDPAQGLANLVDLTSQRPVGLFLHHSHDDPNVAFGGCCTDPTMSHCCCGLSDFVDQCQSATDFVDMYGKTVNHCQGEPIESMKHAYRSERSDVTCYQAGSDCWANTTYCVHNHRGHFNHPSFGQAFPMTEEVMDFFSKDACESVGGGSWSLVEKECSCGDNATFAYCLDGGWKSSHQEPDWTNYSPRMSNGGGSAANFGAIAMAILIVIAFCATFVLMKEEQKYRQFKAVSTFELSDFSVDPKLEEEEEDFYRPKPVFNRPSLSKHI